MASSIIAPIAASLAAHIAQVTVDGTALKGHPQERREFDQVPCGAVAPPTISLGAGGAGEARGPIGGTDWALSFPVSLYFDLAEVVRSQNQMIDAVEQYTVLLDNDPTLAGSVDDCAVTGAEPFTEQDRGRPLVGYLITVRVETLIPTN